MYVFIEQVYINLKKKINEFLLPYIWEGIKRFIKPLKKTELPIVGFCGQNNQYRKKTLNLLKSNKKIKCNFIIRKQFWGGKPHGKKIIRDFENNMINSHFNVCNRGAGNFSMRFYQTLSAGRIPILLNTDIILPFEEEIDWENNIIIGNTEDEIVNKLLNYWNTKNIIEMQNKCKEIYNNYFSGNKFFNKILSE